MSLPNSPNPLNMHSRLSLRKNFSWNFVGNIVYAVCQWGMLVVLAKLTIPAMVGRFALGLAVTAPIIMLSNLQLRGIQATDARGEYHFGHYLGLRLITTVLAMLIILVVTCFGSYSLEIGIMILAVGFSKAFESISDVFYGFMQRHERMDCIAKSRMIKGPISLCVLSAFVYATGNVLWGVVGMALTWGLILVAYDLPSATLIRKLNNESIYRSSLSDNLRPIFEWKPLLRLTWLALPLGVVMGLLSLKPNIPRYFIEYYWGERDLGIFAALAYLIVAGNTIVGAMGQATTPRLANYYAAGEFLRFGQLLLRLSILGVVLGAAGVGVALWGGCPLLSLLYGSEYAVHGDVFVWLMVAGAVAYVASFLGYGITAARYFKIQMPLFIIVTSATAISAWFLVQDYGVLGASLSLAIGACLQLIGSAMIIFHALYLPSMKRKNFDVKLKRSYPMRVLHVVGGMNRGGVESWLMHILRNIDRERFQFDFMVHTAQACAYDEEIRRLGSKIIPCMHPSRPWVYAKNFRRVFREYGPYDVVHSHVHHYSGFVLWRAHKAGALLRIAHSHNDISPSSSSSGAFRKVYFRFMKHLIHTHATLGVAASGKAASALFGPNWRKDPRWKILYCGVDLRPFVEQVNQKSIRLELGLPQNALVVGHVGRFSQQKNHSFLVDIAAELIKREPKTHLLLIGDGPLRPVIEEKVSQLGLSKNFVFAGLRADVPRLMLGAMDVFLFPSLYEGLGLVLVEAQAAGLPCVFSDVVPPEADLIIPLIHRCQLKNDASIWSDTVFHAKDPMFSYRVQAPYLVERSPFNIFNSLRNLKNIYNV